MASVNRYRTWVQAVLSAPITLQGQIARKLTQAIALAGDVLAQMAIEAVYARSLDSETFPADALYLVGAERRMARYPAETDAGYRVRLTGAWEARLRMGTAPAIVSQLAAAGFTAEVKDTRDWNWDGDAANWSRMWTVITGHPFDAWAYGDAYVWDGPQTWDSTATLTDIALLRAIAREWKPAHIKSEQVVVVFDLPGWEATAPNGTWNEPANRFQGAAYLQG